MWGKTFATLERNKLKNWLTEVETWMSSHMFKIQMTKSALNWIDCSRERRGVVHKIIWKTRTAPWLLRENQWHKQGILCKKYFHHCNQQATPNPFCLSRYRNSSRPSFQNAEIAIISLKRWIQLNPTVFGMDVPSYHRHFSGTVDQRYENIGIVSSSIGDKYFHFHITT